ncbi:hypothetical protein BDR26DRAFT_1008349 [Obelidium mucronatum]|nr:hypothetical protein BDR26DRAFT_1008349 [Obelidium mucronatum]
MDGPPLLSTAFRNTPAAASSPAANVSAANEHALDVDLYIGRQRVVAVLCAGELTVRGAAKEHLRAPVTLVTLKVLGVKSASKSLFSKDKESGGKEIGREGKAHFQLITPQLTLPMFAASLSDFKRFRSEIDTARAKALESCCGGSIQKNNPNNQVSLDLDSIDLNDCPPTGKALLEWLKRVEDSNQRCGGCGRPENSWLVVEKHVWIGLIVCDSCSGFYRGLPDFIVRSFLYDVTVFEDRDSNLYKAVSSISNFNGCMKLKQLEQQKAPTPATPPVNPAPTTLRLFYSSSNNIPTCTVNDDVVVDDDSSRPIPRNDGSISDDGYEYTYMPPPPPGVGAGNSKISPKSKLQQSLLKTQGKIRKLLSGNSSHEELKTRSGSVSASGPKGRAIDGRVQGSTNSTDGNGFLKQVTVIRRASFSSIGRKRGGIPHSSSMADIQGKEGEK